MKAALLIPCYEPNDKVLPYLSLFRKGDFDAFLLVDDGSGEKYQKKFEEIEEKTVFSLLSYPKNKGKGYALRLGIAALKKKIPDLDFVVTADSDGQHDYHDVLRAKEEAFAHPDSLTLGQRDFSGEDVPGRSRFGNLFSSRYFYLRNGVVLPDTQCGLRAIPKALFPLALAVEGDRYEYEMRFLNASSHLVPFHLFLIKTIYEDDNKGSHFNPFLDGMKVYQEMFVLSFLESFRVAFNLLACFLLYRYLPQYGFFFAEGVSMGVTGLLALAIASCSVFVVPTERAKGILGYLAYLLLNFALSASFAYGISFVWRAYPFYPKMVGDALSLLLFLALPFFLLVQKRKRKASF